MSPHDLAVKRWDGLWILASVHAVQNRTKLD
jgi:hypothetical protein